MTHREIKKKIKIEGEKFQSRISQSILDLKKRDSKSGSGETCPPSEGLARPGWESTSSNQRRIL
jgi:hypothetical protein